jgi:predicted Zn-dependent protease
MLLSQDDAKSICHKVLRYVKADDASVSLEGENHSHLRFAANAFRTSGLREDVEVRVTVWIGNKKGSSSTNTVDEDSLKAVVEQAERLARVSPVDPEYLPTLTPQSYRATHGYVEATANIPLAERAQAISEVIAACEKEEVVGAGFH